MPHLDPQLAYSDQAIEQFAAHDARVQRLRIVPSIGPATATVFVATLDDVQRFRHSHQVEAYLGLVPRELSSGETQRRGHITKAGHARVRWLLIQAAVSILRRRPSAAAALWSWAHRITTRRGKPVAVVALARRLAGILYVFLQDDRVYEPPRRRRAGRGRRAGRVLRRVLGGRLSGLAGLAGRPLGAPGPGPCQPQGPRAEVRPDRHRSLLAARQGSGSSC